MSNPYSDLPSTAFWRTGVADLSPFSVSGLWTPKFPILPRHRIVTAGSCFAQHIGRALAARGYNWFDAEPAPSVYSEEVCKRFNYGVFSFRTGNIYTASALRQWVSWALGEATPPDEVWESDGRFYDPFRPAIEPGGFADAQELFASRAATLDAIRRAIETGHRFVFTMGLTEGWVNTAQGYTYAMCPGTIAGRFDENLHAFKNFESGEIRRDMAEAVRMMRAINPALRVLLTVSPVPLTATASDRHVLVATTFSKSALRTVAGEMAARNPAIDYFPSYEIITAPPYRGMFYEPNMRSVHPDGVAFVMKNFFAGLGEESAAAPPAEPTRADQTDEGEDDLVCEERMLDSFAGPAA